MWTKEMKQVSLSAFERSVQSAKGCCSSYVLPFIFCPPSCQEAANGPVQPFLELLLYLSDSLPGTCLAPKGQCASPGGCPCHGSCLRVGRKIPPWVPVRAHGFYLILKGSHSSLLPSPPSPLSLPLPAPLISGSSVRHSGNNLPLTL